MYICDICGTQTPGKETCTHFDQNRVLTSPAYWELLILEKNTSEEMMGGFLAMFVNDRSGFHVCDTCKEKLENDKKLGDKYGIAKYTQSIPGGAVNSHSAGMVAGTVFKKLKGKWPNTIQIGTGSEPTVRVESTKENKSDCFVATAVYSSGDCSEVILLRLLRDRVIRKNRIGRAFIWSYYKIGPWVARSVDDNKWMKRRIKRIFDRHIIPMASRMLRHEGL